MKKSRSENRKKSGLCAKMISQLLAPAAEYDPCVHAHYSDLYEKYAEGNCRRDGDLPLTMIEDY